MRSFNAGWGVMSDIYIPRSTSRKTFRVRRLSIVILIASHFAWTTTVLFHSKLQLLISCYVRRRLSRSRLPGHGLTAGTHHGAPVTAGMCHCRAAGRG